MREKKQNKTRKSSCVNARGIPPAVSQVLAMLVGGGTPSSHGGGGTLGPLHHPDLARVSPDLGWGTNPQTWLGYPSTIQTWPGYPPTIQTWPGYPPPSRPGQGTPQSGMGHPPHHADLAGVPPPRPGWGTPSHHQDLTRVPPHKCGQIHRLMSKHYLPSYFVRGR